jgi:hypothetical protein
MIVGLMLGAAVLQVVALRNAFTLAAGLTSFSRASRHFTQFFAQAFACYHLQL